MATDVLTLGPFTFDDWSTPEKLPADGQHKKIVHRMPGGTRTVDCMGPDDAPRRWSGLLKGADALSQALLLDALRKAGAPLPYTNAFESRVVIIDSFRIAAVKLNVIEYEISVDPIDGGEDGGGGGGIGDLIGSDLAAAIRLF